jgi:RNA polymerase sigma-70 factor (ECF subfamily)
LRHLELIEKQCEDIDQWGWVVGILADYKTDEIRWRAMLIRAQSGDEAIYRLLLIELASVTRAFLLSRFGQFEQLEDVVQESLIALHRARHTYRPDQPFRAWFFAIVHNRCIDSLRKRLRIERTRECLSHDLIDETEDMDIPIYEGQLLSRLRPPYRQAFILTKLEGLSIAESAEQLGISEATLRVRVFRALRMVRKMLLADIA